MLWILLAALAHVANGLVFIVDKSLLGTKTAIGRPIQYALYSAALAGMVLLLFPFAQMQFGIFLVTWSLIAGAVHIAALYFFFTAMRAGEASRVVPITGSIVPLCTIIFAFFFLGELFTILQMFGMVVLIIGGALLSLRFHEKKKLAGRILLLSLIAGVAFAAYFALTKYIYTHVMGQFFGIFLTTRLAESFLALVGIGGLLLVSQSKKRKTSPQKKKISISKVSFIFIGNKVLAAGAFLLQSYAISLGSVSVVNALQGVQYVFVFLLAVVVSRYIPKLFQEEIRKDTLMQKIIGIVLVSIGVALLV